MVMDEMEALDTVGGNLEEIYYETQERLSQRGKGKGKKGKGKGNAKTFGSVDSYPGFGNGKGGGYLEHRRQLQASRTGHGNDKRWMAKQGFQTPCRRSSQGPGTFNAKKLGTGHVNVLRGEDHPT